jgi:hypothetical protein
MIAKRIFLILMLPLLVASSLTTLIPYNTSAQTFNGNQVISDAVFNDHGSMNAAQIDNFLNGFASSCISPNSGFSAVDPIGYNPSQGFLYGGNVSAGTVISHAATAYNLNPQVLIATLQKEQSLITGEAGCSTNRIAKSLGYGCPDGGSSYSYSNVSLYTRNGTAFTSVSGVCVNSAAKAGFSQQIIHAAWMLKYSQQRSLGNIGWAIIKGGWDNSDDLNATFSGYMTQGCYKRSRYDSNCTNFDGYATIDNTTVHMDTGATAALYRYTPHFSGNQHFVSIFSGWFGSTLTSFSSMADPRWMQLKTDVQKIDIRTEQPVDDVLTAGRQILFTSRFNLNGQTCLRTDNDTRFGEYKCILLSSLEELSITPVSLTSPEQLQAVVSTAQKRDIRHGKNIGSVLPSSRQIHFSSKYTLAGTTYYISSVDVGLGNEYGIAASQLRPSLPFVPTSDTSLQLTTDTTKVVPPTGESIDATLPAGLVRTFNSRANIGGTWYYRTETDDFLQLDKGIPSSKLSLVFSSFMQPRWMQLKVNTTKVNPLDGSPSGSQVATGEQLMFSSKVKVGDTWYYRALADSQQGLPYAIPAADIEEIPFEPMAAPRNLKLIRNTRKEIPNQGLSVDGTLPQGMVRKFVSRTTVNGVLYVRTETDENNGFAKGIKFSDLTEQ